MLAFGGGQVLQDSRVAGLPPTDSAPIWLRLLMLVAGRLPQLSATDGFSPRAVVAAPTARHLPMALAASAVIPPPTEWVSPIAPDANVATVLSRQFQDVHVSSAQGTRLNLQGTQLDPASRQLPPAAVLPEEWDVERGARVVPPSAVEKLKKECPSATKGRSVVGEWVYQQMCLEPIVVLTQRPARVVEEATELFGRADWWNWSQQVALTDVQEGHEWWFRRPVVVLSPQAALGLPWTPQVQVRLVVVVGFSTWMTPARHQWSSAPQVLILNQRSTDVAAFREWFDGTSFGEVSIPGARNNKKGGLTLTAFGEPRFNLVESDDDEWTL